MKRTRKLIPAVVMLMISVIMVSTASYAWFSMNTQVTATGMTVQAKAEGGIVISNSSKSSWSASEDATVASAALYPTSNAKDPKGNWYHNKSTDANDAAAGQLNTTYENLTTTSPALGFGSGNTEGIAYRDLDNDGSYDAANDAAYYLMNKFYIKSSGDALNNTLYINEVSVESSATLLAIDNALRVCIVVGDETFLYAPVHVGADGPTLSYKVAGSGTNTIALAGTVKNTATQTTTIANTDAAAVEVQIYIYFEGEDANCKSTNISGITVDELTVSVVFGITTM